MDQSASLFDLLICEIGKILDPIAYAMDNPRARERLLAAVGVTPAGGEQLALIGALGAVAELKAKIEGFATLPVPSIADIGAILDLSDKAFSQVRALNEADGTQAAFEGLGVDLANFLLGNYLFNHHPLAGQVASLLTLIEPGEISNQPPVIENGVLLRDFFFRDRFRLNRFVDLLRHPYGALRSEYGNAFITVEDANAVAEKLFPRLQRVLRTLGMSCRYGIDPADTELLAGAAPFLNHALILYAADPLAGAPAEAGVVLTLSPSDRGDLGLVISPFGTLTLSTQIGRWALESSLTSGIDVLAYGRHGLTLLANESTTQVDGSLSGALSVLDDDAPAFIFGAPTGSRLEVGEVLLKALVSLSDARQSLELSADVSKSTIIIAPGDGDGFMDGVLPADGLRADFDLGLGWSSDKGFTLRGSASLEAMLPVNVSVAGVSISGVHIGLRANDDEVSAEISASFSASIGPVQAAIDRVGISGALSFPEDGGNLGVVDLDLGFKPPSGIGLSIDAHGVLTGGGFLFHDPAQHLYAGVMQLTLHEYITLKGVALIATQLPDGSRGYSMLVFVTAEDFRPIPLGMGFNLLGIGGMIGIHRTFNENALREGLKTGNLASLLFPRDPVANASAIVRAMGTSFPARRGSYLLGLLAKIGWFTPPLVQADLALILEFGARSRLLVLGRISVLLPSRSNDLVRLNLDSMGVIDFDQGTASIDAVLVDSRLAHKFPITGSMALRAQWGSGPGSNFVLAIGGLNPRFAPPAGLPKLDRLAIALSSGDNPRLVCDAYFAITSNSVQFGARAHLYAAALGFSLVGDIGFDVLVQLVPLHFIADFQASVQLKRGSHNLFKVSVKGELEGPRPLRVSGKASFEICWFDFTVRFDKVLVGGEKPPLPAAVNVLAELKTALASPHNWSMLPASDRRYGVTLRKLPPSETLVLDPLGRLVVKQQVVPLNSGRDIDTYGGAPVAGARRFRLGATLNGQTQNIAPVRDQFAPSQYFEMSDDDKLSGPSFETMDAGLSFGSDQVSFDAAKLVAAPLEYEPITIDDLDETPQPQPQPRFQLQLVQLQALVKTGAAARAPLRHAGLARFRQATPVSAAHLNALQWAIVPLDQGAPAALDASVKTWSEHSAALATLNRGGAHWQLVPAYELAA